MSLDARLRPRPLSPHLAIYWLTLTMMKSIAHRMTGAALYFGTLILTWRMRFGMQVILEGYVHRDRPKVVSLALNNFFSAAVAIAGVFTVLKIAIQTRSRNP